VDFGQSRDPTAITVLERAETTGEWDAVMFAWKKVVSLQLRCLERIALGTPYPEVVERVVQVTRSPELTGRCRLAVDGTGVGRPVVDLPRRAGPACVLMAVNITSGLKPTEEGGYYGVPKRDLILGLQVLLQRKVPRIAAGLEHGADLLKEMAAMQVKITLPGHEQYAVWRKGRTTTWYWRSHWHAGTRRMRTRTIRRAGSSGGPISTRRTRPGYSRSGEGGVRAHIEDKPYPAGQTGDRKTTAGSGLRTRLPDVPSAGGPSRRRSFEEEHVRDDYPLLTP